MKAYEPLYDSFGELIYAIIKSNDQVHKKEVSAMEELLAGYSFGEYVFWSFNYESNHDRSVEDAYDRALEAFVAFGPCEIYEEFFDVLEAISHQKAFAITDREKKVINRFKKELLNRLAIASTDGAEEGEEQFD